jgi:hypothetical protein
MKIATSLIVVLAAVAIAHGQAYRTYDNARFGYSISYPSKLLAPQGEAENGDGQVFLGAGAEMRVYGSNLLLNETLAAEYRAILKEKGSSVTYKVLKRGFFVISGKQDGRIFYQKTLENSDGAFITFMIEYDESRRKTYDPAVTRMVRSFG